ncbi:accessory Sec system translocase SecA2 [Streptomonospora nanhaiensis]|uniref:Protein translocase subunit SecA n=1 Tax=Streptomonospora nanhaiensis TaxID=1323731 RepID=A0A853BUF5_9ACTN|nr:accessory Sec system translocase SecA2 [Streptomonospora nanhaiensis]MBV2365819.1 accessory Sec system translocase SecA2 [Streptomonospora nanhaiensis]MBX9391382.1 accessory Sec system translocase SecA2 [Streptomonospora nanhaiensis]NYI98147.1 preprotein translocase subunit SecA [Streptomonospora nanhaiensis]
MAESVRRLLGRPGAVDLRPYSKLLEAIEAREPELRELSDSELTDKAAELGNAELPYDRQDLVELCAVGREAARRALDERPYDVQLLGVMALLDGHIAEMATGEGKTLAGALAAAGFALRGQRVHVLSVNDYLARRDAEWMAPLYERLGVAVGWISEESTPEERRAAYAADVTYASVSELGFDVLRDRMVTDVADRVVPEPNIALIDEADSVLVDEARVPLVLAGAAESTEADLEMADLVRRLTPRVHYEVDVDGRNVQLTDAGIDAVEKELGGIDLYDEHDTSVLPRVNLALHAHVLLQRDVHYVVRDGEVRLINESRGRIALLQRWPDGLQAAVEAKEKVAVSETGEVLDSITVQSLVLRYPTRCGMTGTAMAVAEQLREFYELEVAVIPPNKPNVREDDGTRLYATREEKEDALVEEVAEVHRTGRPILIGTQDVAESELLAKRLADDGLECVVLNAKNDAEEAGIIAEAGTYGAITVSTQMAGRGTDIRLGGSDMADRDRVVDKGGLYVMGFGRYPSSRLDDQLRGRAGRQGDPGASVFFVSVEDDLVANNAPETRGYEAEGDGAITDPSWLQMVDHAQRVSEGNLLEVHRNTWRYNQLIDVQRGVVLEHREAVLTDDLGDRQLKHDCPERHAELVEQVGEEEVARAARLITLYHLDRGWTDHNAFLAELREGIHLRFLGRRDPLDEFNRDAVPAFKGFLDEARARAAETFLAAEVGEDGTIDVSAVGVKRPSMTWTYMVHDHPFSSALETVVGRIKGAVGSGESTA